MTGKIPISHGSGQMRAQSISVQVSTRTRCNAGCRFCISRTTPGVADQQSSKDIKLCDFGRLEVGLHYARQLGASHAVLTSRADPTQEDEAYLCALVSTCHAYLPLVDMHTNGYFLLPGKPKSDLLRQLAQCGLTMVTFSIASFEAGMNRDLMLIKEGPGEMIQHARDLGLLVRCSLVVNKSGIKDFEEVRQYVRSAGDLGAHMVVVREVWLPEVYGNFNSDVYSWNQANWIDIKPIQDTFERLAEDRGNGFLRQLAPLPWGTPVFGIDGIFADRDHGVNVTFARCEEATAGSVLKSIVHRPDGHGYRNWDSRSDILY